MTVRTALWWVTAVALGAWVALHFTLVLLYSLPANPISQELRGTTGAYIVPLFSQSWALFAPNPSAIDRGVYVRGTYVDGDREETTPWLPVTDPLIKAVQDNRLSSEHLTLIVVLNAIYSLTSHPGLLSPDPATREPVIDGWADLPTQPAALIVLEEAGSAVLAAAYPDIQFRQVQVMLTVRPLPRFTERDAPESSIPTEHVVFRPVPFQPAAAWSPPR